MTKQIFFALIACFIFNNLADAQTVRLEAYVFEDNNRGFLNEVEIKICNILDASLVAETRTNREGFFSVSLPVGKDYLVKASKDLFFPKEEKISTKTNEEKVFAKLKMERKPGYIFDVTLAESGAPNATVDAISGARIEVYNNTKQVETLVVDSLDGINFDVTFERGNHYTVLIRKVGYFNKRLEAYVDVEGCILCFEGVGTVTPGVSDVMSQGFQMGSVLANIELDPARLNRTIRIDNIYYDLDKFDIRPDAAKELDKIVRLLNDNPTIIIELGSHTDSRGGDRYNMRLSSNRAKAAVDYIITQGGISADRITSKGYGESQLVNGCRDGKKCTEEEHQENRRTELKIVGFDAVDPLADKSLAEMLTEERLMWEVNNSEQIQVGSPFDAAKVSRNASKDKPAGVVIKSVEQDKGETLVEGGNAAVDPISITGINLDYEEDKVLIIAGGKVEIMEKMAGNQLNSNLTDRLVGKEIYAKDKDDGLNRYQFDHISEIPIPLLNVFLKRIALLEQNGGWHIFTVEKGDPLPKEILEVLK